MLEVDVRVPKYLRGIVFQKVLLTYIFGNFE